MACAELSLHFVHSPCEDKTVVMLFVVNGSPKFPREPNARRDAGPNGPRNTWAAENWTFNGHFGIRGIPFCVARLYLTFFCEPSSTRQLRHCGWGERQLCCLPLSRAVNVPLFLKAACARMNERLINVQHLRNDGDIRRTFLRVRQG
jgi:hypothetical protein